MSFFIKIDLKMIRFYGWYGRKIPVAKGTPVTMATLYFYICYLYYFCIKTSQLNEKKPKSQPMGVSPFAWFLAGVLLKI